MNTDSLQQIKEQVAKDHSFADWNHLLKAHSGKLDHYINTVSERYAAACVEYSEEQRKRCISQNDSLRKEIDGLFTLSQLQEACRKTLEKAAENAVTGFEVDEIYGTRYCVKKDSINDPSNIVLPPH